MAAGSAIQSAWPFTNRCGTGEKHEKAEGTGVFVDVGALRELLLSVLPLTFPVTLLLRLAFR
jgi:hypothetical protein